MQFVEGIVVKVIETPSKYAGKGPLYTTLLVDDSGREHGVYYNFGPIKPPFDIGDRVKLGVEFQGAKRAKFIEGQGELLQKSAGIPQQQPPASSTSPAPTSGGGSSGGYRNRYDDPKTQQSISYQSSRKDALALLAMALQHEALPLGNSKGKRYEVLKAELRKLAAELYQDLQDIDATLKVTDEGAPKGDVGELPDREEAPANDDEIKLDGVEVAPPKAASTGRF